MSFLATSGILCLGQSGQKWSVNGNNVNAGDVIGTNNDHPLILRADGTDLMWLSTDGMIGVGTSSPTSNFHIEGALRFNDGSAQLGYVLTSDALGNATWQALPSTSPWEEIGGNIVYTGGNVGIGTSSPLEKLSVNGNILSSGTVEATGLSIVEFVMTKRGLLIENVLCIGGDDGTGATKNELFTENSAFYLQSSPFFNYNTLINFDNTGFVGIGTDNPTAKLHVNGDFNLDGGLKISTLSDLSAIEDGFVMVRNDGSFTRSSGLSIVDLLFSDDCRTDVNGNFHPMWSSVLGTPGITTGILFAGYDCDVDVAIGTNVPEAKLDVRGDAHIQNGLMIGTLSSDHDVTINGDIRLLGDASSGMAQNDAFEIINAGLPVRRGICLPTDPDGSFKFYIHQYMNDAAFHFISTDPTQTDPEVKLMSMYKDGTVCIGTDNTPNTWKYKLYVADGILTERIKVAVVGTGDWSDFVFEDDYKLRGLDEVEDFIAENGHLPDVPSAAQVEENGYDMTTMDATLLQKIEELTLYIIELENRIDELEEEE